jgi:hypothetical protein
MQTLNNKDRMFFGIVEFTIIGLSIGFFGYLFEGLNEKYLNGWLMWLLGICYILIYPFFFNGRTPFMHILGFEIRDKGKNQINRTLFLERLFLKDLFFLLVFEFFYLLIWKEEIPHYDKILKTNSVKP